MTSSASVSKYNYDPAVLQLISDFKQLSATTTTELIAWLEIHFIPTKHLRALVELLKDPSLVVKSKKYYKSRGKVSIFITFFNKKTGQVSLRSTTLQIKAC